MARRRAARFYTERAEWDHLAAELNRRGVRHIAPAGPTSGESDHLTDDELFRRLWTRPDARLQEATIALLLTAPDLAPAARSAIEHLSGTTRDRAMRRYVAAAALQRLWRTRLLNAIGPSVLIPPDYVAELGLPPLDEDFGRTTLWTLSAREEELYGYDAWAGYTSLADLLLAEMTLAGWGKPRA